MSMNRPSILALLTVASLVLSGCGFNSITENEASEGWRVAGAPLGEAQQNLQEELESDSGMGFPTGETTVSVDCDEGGALELTADISFEGGAPSVEMTADYNDCEDQQVTVNGALDLTFPDGFPMGDSSEGETTRIRYVGELDFRGDVDGPCEIDMTSESSGGSRPTYSGQLCEYDASDILGSAF
jgi:hypothetical protein